MASKTFTRSIAKRKASRLHGLIKPFALAWRAINFRRLIPNRNVWNETPAEPPPEE